MCSGWVGGSILAGKTGKEVRGGGEKKPRSREGEGCG